MRTSLAVVLIAATASFLASAADADVQKWGDVRKPSRLPLWSAGIGVGAGIGDSFQGAFSGYFMATPGIGIAAVLSGTLNGPSGEKYEFSTALADEVFRDAKETERVKGATTLFLVIDRIATPYYVVALTCGLQLSYTKEYYQYYDRYHILGEDGHYYLEGGTDWTGVDIPLGPLFVIGKAYIHVFVPVLRRDRVVFTAGYAWRW